MIYSIEKDGDLYEIRYWEFLRKDFPNYEVFWRRFIVPLTGRVDGSGIQLRDNTDPLLESIAMAHYSVFYHLGKAAFLQTWLGQEFSEDTLFHLSSATEMVERLIIIIAKLVDRMEGIDLAGILTEDAISSIAHEYFSSYGKDFERFLDKGQAVNVRLHKIDDVTKRFMGGISDTAGQDFKKWQDIAMKIRHYRNALAHNPRMGRVLGENEAVFVPKESELHLYELWSQMAHRSDNYDLVQLTLLLADFQSNLVEKTDALWAYLIDLMEELSKTEYYTRLHTSGGPTILFTDNSQGPPAVSPMPSGTSSYDPKNGFNA